MARVVDIEGDVDTVELIVNVGDRVIVVAVTDEVGDGGDDVILVEVKDDSGDGIIIVEDTVEDDVEERAVDVEGDVDTAVLIFDVGDGVIAVEVTDEVEDDVIAVEV